MRSQVGRVVAAVVVAGAVISGCGGPVQAGSAVIIGDRAISLEEVQSQVSSVLAKSRGTGPAPSSSDSAELARSVVASEILHSMLSRKAAEYGIEVTDAQVDEKIATLGGAEALLAGTTSDLSALRTQVRDTLMAVQIGQRIAPRLAVTVELVGIGSSPDEAKQAARVLASGGPEADALLAGPTAQRVVLQAGSFPIGPASVVLGLPEGAAGAFQPSRQEAGWNAFRVVERRTDVPVDPAAAPVVTEEQATLLAIRDAQLAGELADIRVNPRYGEWDPIQGKVVPEGQQVGKIILPSSEAAA